MLEKIRYVNNRGEVLNFGANGIYVNENDLRDWEWKYDTSYGRIRSFSRSAITRTLPVEIWAASETDGLSIKNRLHDVTEVDVLAETPGRLYVGDCYMLCYITASKKSNYLMSRRILSVKLTVAASEGVWYQENKFWFGGKTGLSSALVGEALVGYAKVGSDGGEVVDTSIVYDYDYPRGYDVDEEDYSGHVVNDFRTPCHFRLEVQGYAANPEVVIGPDAHKLNYTAVAGQTIVVDSRERTIKAINSDGLVVNLFRYRDKEADIFAPIPEGAHNVTWNGDFLFILTLYKERSEPLWT